MNSDAAVNKQTQDTARVLLHVMRRMVDEEFKQHDGKIIYLIDSDIVALYANPQRRHHYTDAFLPESEDAAALAWTVAEYIFTTRRLGITCMAPPHRYETLSNLEAVMHKAGKEAKSVTRNELLTFLDKLATHTATSPERTFYQDNRQYKKLIQMLYGYADGASKNFETRRFLMALRERWIEPVESVLPEGTWPSEQDIQDSINVWYDNIRRTRKMFSHDTEDAALAAQQKLAENEGTAKALRDYADAVVLASIEAANDKLIHHKIKMLLLTGSPTLHLAGELHAHDGKQSFGHRYLRGPLMLLAAPDLLPDVESSSPAKDLALFFERALLPDMDASGNHKGSATLLCKALFGGLDETPASVKKELGLSDSDQDLTQPRAEETLTTEVKQNLANAIRVSAVKLRMPTLEEAHQRAQADLLTSSNEHGNAFERFEKLIESEGRKTTNDFLATLFELGLEQLLRESQEKCGREELHLEFRRGTPYIDFGKFKLAERFYLRLADTQYPADLVNDNLRELRDQMLEDDDTRYTLALVYGLAFAHLGAWPLCVRCAEFALGIALSLDCEHNVCSEKTQSIRGDEAAYLLASARRHAATDSRTIDEASKALEQAVEIWSESNPGRKLDLRMRSERLALEVSRWTLVRYSPRRAVAKTNLKPLAELQSAILEMLNELIDQLACEKEAVNVMWCILEEQLLTNLFIVTLMREIPEGQAKGQEGDPKATEIFSGKRKRGLTFYLAMYRRMIVCTHKGRVSALVKAVFYVVSASYDKDLASWNTSDGYSKNMAELRLWCEPGLGLLPRDLKRMKEYLKYVEQHVPPPASSVIHSNLDMGEQHGR